MILNAKQSSVEPSNLLEKTLCRIARPFFNLQHTRKQQERQGKKEDQNLLALFILAALSVLRVFGNIGSGKLSQAKEERRTFAESCNTCTRHHISCANFLSLFIHFPAPFIYPLARPQRVPRLTLLCKKNSGPCLVTAQRAQIFFSFFAHQLAQRCTDGPLASS